MLCEQSFCRYIEFIPDVNRLKFSNSNHKKCFLITLNVNVKKSREKDKRAKHS